MTAGFMAGPREFRLAPLLIALVTGCGADPVKPTASPVLESAAVSPGPHNVLSAVVHAVIQDADSARVIYGIAGGEMDGSSPVISVSPGTNDLPVLGLLPGTTYQFAVLAYGDGGSTIADARQLTTGPLPVDLPAFTAGGTSPGPGFVAFAAASYGIVVDNTGRVVWYRSLTDGPTLNFQVVASGHYATSPVTPAAANPRPWVLYDVLGNEVARLGCAGGLVSRFHEIRVDPTRDAWLLCDETRTLNLTAIGGSSDAKVIGTVVQHLDHSGVLLFAWNAFDHFALTDLDSASRSGQVVNFTHGNALDFDPSGHLLLSFRSLNEITSVDTATGNVRWRLGGRANQFTFEGGSWPFVGQHGLRAPRGSELQFLDNRSITGDSRAIRWQLDEAARTVRPVASFHGSPPVEAQLGGSTQALPGGGILVAYGNGHRVQEYDAAGNVVWEIHGDPGYIFRATRMPSLYRLMPLDARGRP
jgi:hypothetical protein